ncbi:MAG: amidohydrolase [Candidatus Parabeggiatoa sp. nov. 3]|nr:MAG: amidohydrolase [Gammaproteobacteria bacterium]RKZ64405.1 MAG: amidohydrolase [Gammaproteobacteria bacterium]RKZ85052.1 MAG: amidohydrolase [Gammaproteobacteria bacterium]
MNLPGFCLIQPVIWLWISLGNQQIRLNISRKSFAERNFCVKLNYEGLLDALWLLNKNGITSVCEARTYWKRGFQDAWLRAEQENTLTVRAVLGLWAYPSMADAAQLSGIKALYRNNPNDLLRISQIKLYNDGILINSTAAMLAPYLEKLGNIPSNNGLNYFTEERLTRYIAELEPVGFDFHIHAIGDRAVRESINAIEAAQSSSGRHRLTHLEVVSPADYPRFKALNITADMQVAGTFSNPEHWAENEFLIGDRGNNLIPLKGLHEAGARITLSSDWDVSTLNPFVGMQNALTRAPQNLPDLATVIHAYTMNPAYVMRQETKVGSIEVGKEADLIVLDKNLFEIPIQSISQTQVLMTFLQGEIVYEKK